MEIKDNEFQRQFETTINNNVLLSVEYSLQERKLFLTRVNMPEGFEDDEVIAEFLKEILAIAEEKRLKVVPVHPKAAAFFKKNPQYKELLPPGIRI
ncbi:N-acetyltransferase [Flavobacterium salilacus subsp. salilacus]|uniref:GNAT family N-acetyltransferase n=1 Tax=Flavobacterium TaxID=237 RepID=UPI001074DD87|nr:MULTISPECIES: N-acetyltransferase [Flavobacterium]KAF2518493.1 N-acetyltransferase [Flavobacterium salilacus subsp. salilacus]MBE1615133.1 N-acetyltransferase [Flavobacterium sp. SaA2.13]NDI98124.1 N-acetyltransferase [Flavobacterium salilacus subsp. altitudinum]